MKRKTPKPSPPTAELEAPEPAAPATVPVSVIMITKNCAEGLENCLGSLYNQFLRGDDEVVIVDTGSTDNTVAVAEEFGARVIRRPDLTENNSLELVERWLPGSDVSHPQLQEGFLLDFAAARQIATDAAKNDVVFWIDADDVLEESRPGALRDAVDQVFGKGLGDGIFLDYHYQHDKDDGRVTLIQKRERIVDRRTHRWAGRCHEVFLQLPEARGSQYLGDGSRIVHVPQFRKDHTFSDVRNYVIIRNEVEETSPRVDPRSLLYLANAARGLFRFQEAFSTYERFLGVTGSRDDAFHASYLMAMGYMHPEVRRPTTAQRWFFRCLKIKPEDPRGYFGLARAALTLERYAESLHWFRTGAQLPEPGSLGVVHAYNPEEVRSEPLRFALLAAIGAEDESLVRGFGEDLRRARGDNPLVRDTLQYAQRWLAGRNLAKSLEAVAVNHTATDEPESTQQVRRTIRKLARDLHEVPPDLEKKGLGALEVATDAPVVIWCGPTVEDWGPESAVSGIGGSEKMVLEMAKRLTALGKSTVVYASVPTAQRGVDPATGVDWRHWSNADLERPRESVILWRQPGFVTMPWKARRRVVWCHDVQRPHEYTPAVAKLLNKVVVLSEYHAGTLKDKRAALEADGKLVISRNGLDEELYRKPAEGRRDPWKFVFASSPDRGITTAIRIFEKIRERRPEATLDLYYGFTPTALKRFANYEYGYIADLDCSTNFYDYMEYVWQCIDATPGVTHKGRVSFEAMAEAQKTAGVWLYPTRFSEISCMAAMEAQAAGCLVATTDAAALAETVDWEQGHARLVDANALMPEAAAELIINCVEVVTPAWREDIAAKAQARFGLDSLARDWAQNILG